MLPAGRSLELRGLSITIDGRRIVEELSMTFSPGGVHWIEGPNGSGKSTLLRLMAGAPTPARSTGEFRGTPGDPGQVSWYAPHMGLPGVLRVGDWLRALTGGRVTDPPDPRHSPPSLPRDQPIATLSTGQAKSLLLWAILHRPRGVVLLDEPFAHLSDEARHALVVRLRTLSETQVVLVATHGMSTHRRPQDTLLQLAEGPAWASAS